MIKDPPYGIDFATLEIHALAYIATQSRGTMIDYTDMFTRVQAAEKEGRGMGLRVTPDGKLTPGAEREVEYLLARHGITNARPVLDSQGILRIVPKRGPRPALTPLQGAQREYERASKTYTADSPAVKDSLNALLLAITDTLAGTELAAMAELRRAQELATPRYTFKVDRTNDVLKTGVVSGTMTVEDPGPTKPPAGGCDCIACTALRLQTMRENQSVIDEGRRKATAATLEDLARNLPPFNPKAPAWLSYVDLIDKADEAILKAIMGQGTFSTMRTWDKSPEEAKRNTYRDGPVREESRLPGLLPKVSG